MYKHALIKIIVFTLFVFSANTWAVYSYHPHDTANYGIGQVASNLLVPVTVASSFLSGASIVIGVISLFSAFLRYMQHRINPLAQPISTVILLLLLGVILLLLPLVYKLTESGIPFSLH